MMNLEEIALSLVWVFGFTYVVARTINFSLDSVEKMNLTKKEALRKIHVAAITGDHKAAAEWDAGQEEHSQ